MSGAARKIVTSEVPQGFKLTEEDLKAIAESKARVDAGVPGIPHEVVMRLLEARRRIERP